MYKNLVSLGIHAHEFISHLENWKVLPLDNL